MNKLLKTLAKPLHAWTRKRRASYYKKLQKRLTNTTPTIIANDCFGGLIYHNLGLRFTSPTVNLYIEKDDFIVFVQHLKEYLDADIVEIPNSNTPYPMGKMIYNDTPVRLHFMHYGTFEQAKQKWNERKQRIDWNNIYVILTIESDATQDDIIRFDNLPYKNKLLIVDKNEFDYPYAVTCSVLQKKNYRHGKILEYKSRFSKKRYMDDIDYVRFLNQPNE